MSRHSQMLLLCKQEHTTHNVPRPATFLFNTMLRAFCLWEEKWLISLSQMSCIQSSCNFLHSSSSSFSCLLNSRGLDRGFSGFNWHSLSPLGTSQWNSILLPPGVTKMEREASVSDFGMETTGTVSSAPAIYLNNLHLYYSGPGFWKLLISILAPLRESFPFSHPWTQESILQWGLCHALLLHPSPISKLSCKSGPACIFCLLAFRLDLSCFILFLQPWTSLF